MLSELNYTNPATVHGYHAQGSEMHFSRLKPELLSLAIIFVVPLLILGGAFLPNRTLLPADLMALYPPWQGSIHSQEISNYLLSDQMLLYYPYHKLAYTEMQSTGHIPLWNPYQLTGQPLVADGQSALFYPPNLLLRWLEPESVAGISAYFSLLLLGIGTFYFCRTIELRRISALLAAIIAMLAGPVIMWLGVPIVSSLASLPLMMLAGEKILHGKRLLPWAAIVAAGVDLSILGGHPETAFYACLTFGIYFLIRLIMTKPGIRTAALWLVAVLAGAVLGLLIGAIQWLPLVDFLLHSATLAGGGRSMGGTNVFYSDQWRYNLVTAVTYLIPNFFGSPVTHNYVWPFPTYQNYSEQTVYFGLISLTLSIAGVFDRQRRGISWTLAGISLVFLGVAWRLPGFELVNHLPPFSLLINSRLKFFLPLLMAIVAGIGLDSWLDQPGTRELNRWQRVAILIPGLLTLAVFAAIAILNIYPPALSWLSARYPRWIEQLVYQVFNLNQPRIMISMAAAIIVIILCVLSWRGWIGRAWFGYGVAAMALLELVVLAWQYNPVVERDIVYPKIPLLATFEQDDQPFRTLSTQLSVYPPNAGSAYRVAQVEGYDLPIYSSFYDIYRAQGGEEQAHRQVWAVDFPLVDWLNIRYVISPVAIDKPGYSLVFDQPTYKVYRNENAYPRGYMVYDYQVITDKTQMLQTMVSNPALLNTTVLLNQSPRYVPRENPSPPGEIPARVEFTEYGMDRIVLSVYTERDGYLVVSDLYTTGWKAKVDGNATPVLNADYAYRAVYIPAGVHNVEFYYQPVSYLIGRVITLVGVGVLILLSGVVVYQQRKSQS